MKNSSIDCARDECVAAKKKKSIVVVFVFVVQCLTQHTGRTLQGVGGGCFMGLCWWF